MTGGNNGSIVQDEYYMETNWSLYNKWELVKRTLNLAEDDYYGSDQLTFVNFLSGSHRSFPYFVASGKSSPGINAPLLSTGVVTVKEGIYRDFYRVACLGKLRTIAFTGTNVLTFDLLKSRTDSRACYKVGIVMSDFTGAGLIEKTIRCNSDIYI